MQTETIHLGGYTLPVTRASHDLVSILDQCCAVAGELGRVIAVSRDWRNRWQGWSKRDTARGALSAEDYEWTPSGRRAKRIDVTCTGGRVYLADTRDGSGPVDAVVIHPPGPQGHGVQFFAALDRHPN